MQPQSCQYLFDIVRVKDYNICSKLKSEVIMVVEKVEKKKEETKDISDRRKALELALAQIEKQFGKGSIMKLGGEVRADVESIPTGSLTLDVALGIGGLPRGRVIEIFGP